MFFSGGKMSPFSKKWEDLQFYDNFMFCSVMKDEKLCRRLLEIMLGMEIERIEYLASEHHIDSLYDSRGVRLDIYVKGDDRVFNVEMQTGEYENLMLRARYYQSSMDVDSTERGLDYKNLKETFILFICRTDPFKGGLPVYTKVSRFKETDSVRYDDRTHTFFYNAEAYEKAEDPEVKAFLQYIDRLKAESDFTRELEQTVKNVKYDRGFRNKYMTLSYEIEKAKRIAREEGLTEGRAEGREEGLAEGRAEGREAGLEEGRETGLEQGLTQGLEQGLAQGLVQGEKNILISQIRTKLDKGKTPSQISDEIELSLDETLALIDELEKSSKAQQA